MQIIFIIAIINPDDIIATVSITRSNRSVATAKQLNELWGAGYNHQGQLGLGYTSSYEEQVKIMDDVIKVVAGIKLCTEKE